MLYIIATPIGNLEDLSERAKRILSEVDFILCEDTRHTGILLQKFGIKAKTISFHEHSDATKLNSIIDQLKDDETSMAYVTDAGTPNLSDPGGKLVSAALENNIKISPIPGPSALATLISVAPFSTSEFTFLGYFPKKKGREKIIKTIQGYAHPVFFYESSHRIQKTLIHLSSRLLGYNILIGRELTKIYEEIIYTDISDSCLQNIDPRGEFVFALVKTQ